MRYDLSSLVATLVATTWLPATYAWGYHDGQQVILPPHIPDSAQSVRPEEDTAGAHLEFTLRHMYHAGSHKYPGLLRKLDVTKDTVLVSGEEDIEGVGPNTVYRLQTRPTRIERMVDRSHDTIDSILDAKRMTGQSAYLPPDAWTMDEIPGPNITDKATVLSLAQMAANAYISKPNTEDWEDIKGRFNYTQDFGWEEDGLRGHIFADTKNETVVIALKGTTMAIFDGAETTGHDKENDNLFGSCCCGQGGPFIWKKVCSCMSSAYTCNNTCLLQSLREKSHYYHAAKDLYANVTELYPNSEIWLTGHSLGGVVTSLLGLTYGRAAVTFEAFPDALAAGRLGLPTPPGYQTGRHQDRRNAAIYHFGHTADPVFMGSCNAATASCSLGGYAFQSQCHTGSYCRYDTVNDLGWRSGITTHRISVVVRDVIKVYDDVPTCEVVEDCVDCFNWKFFESNGTESTTTFAPTSTSTTRSSTRTETCKTPGWWGCLDESTSSTVTETSTVTTTTCLTPGWFGCKDEATTTYTTTYLTSAPAPAPTVTTIPTTTTKTSVTTTTTTTCSSKGWWGCNDPTTTSTTTTSTTKTKTKDRATTTCTDKEWFGLICVDPSPDVNPTPTSIS